MPGRLSGFFNQELKIGNLYSAFYLEYFNMNTMTLKVQTLQKKYQSCDSTEQKNDSKKYKKNLTIQNLRDSKNRLESMT